jgi:hypothetical protein
MMNKKTTSIIAIIVTTLICGLPGFAGLCLSMMAVMGALVPDTSVSPDEVGLVLASSAAIAGLSLLCLAVPVGIAIWAWWSRKPPTVDLGGEPIPEDDF